MSGITQQMVNHLTYPSSVALALNNLAKIHSFRYKKYFIVPKVRVTWRMASEGRTYGGLYFSINKKLLRGWVFFDHAIFFDTVPNTQRWIDRWASDNLTRTINSIEVGASMDKTRAKKVVEVMYSVRVK